MPNSTFRLLTLASATFVLSVATPEARADQKAECSAAYEKSQELRTASKLRSAREQLLICAQSECPDFIKRDCSKWLGEVDATLPTLVFSAKASGKDITDVKVLVDGAVVAESLDGRAVPWDPGSQTFVFESAEHGQQEVTLTVKEGQKAQSVEASFGGEGGSGDGVELDTAKADDKTLAYVLGGVGIVGLGAFGFFALTGKSDEDKLACAPTKTCTDDDVDPIKQKYLFADIGLGVGVVSLGIATYLLLSPSGKSEPSADVARNVRVDMAPITGGGFASVSGRF